MASWQSFKIPITFGTNWQPLDDISVIIIIPIPDGGEDGRAPGGRPRGPKAPVPNHLSALHHDPIRAPGTLRHRRSGLQHALVPLDCRQATASLLSRKYTTSL